MTHGHAQVDFGEAWAIIAGVRRKVHYFALDLPHSDACFVKAYPAETTEAFCDGHVAAFGFFGGIPLSILYDNTTLAVAEIKKGGKRVRTETFTKLQSHYLFQDKFARPAKGNEKGKVEGLIGYVRRNYLVPVPRFESFDALNAWLEEQCLKRRDDQLRGHGETIEARLMRDLDTLMALPATPYDACEQVSTSANSISMVRYRNNDYSVPVAYAHHEVRVRGYVHQVVIGCGAEIIARHPRSYEKGDMVFDPMHFLPLLEQKVGALDQAAPLKGWDLGVEFAILHRLQEARNGQGRQTRICPGSAPDGKLRDGGRPWRRQAGTEHGRHWLRCGQASTALPHSKATAKAGPGYLSLPAQGQCRDNKARSLYESPGGGGSPMSEAPELLLHHHLKKLRLPTFLSDYEKTSETVCC